METRQVRVNNKSGKNIQVTLTSDQQRLIESTDEKSVEASQSVKIGAKGAEQLQRSI